MSNDFNFTESGYIPPAVYDFYFGDLVTYRYILKGASNNFSGVWVLNNRLYVASDDTLTVIDLSTDNLCDCYSKLLLHTECDASSASGTITMYGVPKITASVGKFDGSAYFDGGNNVIYSNSSSNLNFGSGDFTVDFWAKIAASQSVDALLCANWEEAGGS